MKLIKFRIQRYKSIIDTGWCWLASDVTTLAGKNESGKSAILEALRDFDTDVASIPDSALPLDDAGEPVIEGCFEVEKTVLDEIAQETGTTISKEVREYISQYGVHVKKHHDGSYGLEGDIKALWNKQRDKSNVVQLEKIQESVTALHAVQQVSSVTQPELKGGMGVIQQSVNQFIEQVKAKVGEIPDEKEKKRVNELINQLTSESSALDATSGADKFLEELKAYIPNFIFFSDFLDILPFELPLAEAKNNKPVQDFALVAGLDLEKVVSTTDSQRRRNILSKHSATISGDFMDYWGQNHLDLIAEPDGEKLRLGVKESGKTTMFKPEQRSKGFQWFLSFYLRLNAERDETNIILIDEPGLYLHAKAQRDVLKVFEKISEESPIVFSTHSPYLVDAHRLDRVRLVIKDDRKGTRLENKIHKGADIETLTPIITAIGLDVTQEFSITGKHNVLLEGISDYYFLQALRRYVSMNDVKFIPCVGAQKIPQLVSLLIGWDLGFVAVLDNDTEGKKIAKELREKLSVEDARITLVAEQDGQSIEDLFTPDDFNSFVLNGIKNDNPGISNSKFLKDKKIDKVLLAKKFFERVDGDKASVALSENTIKAFKRVFERINAGFTQTDSLSPSNTELSPATSIAVGVDVPSPLSTE
jgi:predicted ATP-dependent endonuclease of OLD family